MATWAVTIHQRLDPFTVRQIHDLLRADMQSAKSESDLMERLKAKGYGLRSSNNGTVLTAEPQGIALFPYAPHFA